MRGRRSGWRSRGRRSRLLARRLRVGVRHPGTRAASGPALGTLRSLCEELADGPSDIGTRKRGPKLKHRRKAMPRAAAGRREARRPTSLAGDLRRSEDRPDRKAGHGVRRFRTSACRRSAPLFFFGERRKTKGYPPPSNRAAERWLFDN
jgi:hypothetical protein